MMSLDVSPRELEEALRAKHRHISDERMRKFEGYMGEILTAFGLDLDSPATRTRHNGLSKQCLTRLRDTMAIQN